MRAYGRSKAAGPKWRAVSGCRASFDNVHHSIDDLHKRFTCCYPRGALLLTLTLAVITGPWSAGHASECVSGDSCCCRTGRDGDAHLLSYNFKQLQRALVIAKVTFTAIYAHGRGDALHSQCTDTWICATFPHIPNAIYLLGGNRAHGLLIATDDIISALALSSGRLAGFALERIASRWGRSGGGGGGHLGSC